MDFPCNIHGTSKASIYVFVQGTLASWDENTYQLLVCVSATQTGFAATQRRPSSSWFACGSPLVLCRAAHRGSRICCVQLWLLVVPSGPCAETAQPPWCHGHIALLLVVRTTLPQLVLYFACRYWLPQLCCGLCHLYLFLSSLILFILRSNLSRTDEERHLDRNSKRGLLVVLKLRLK